MQTTIILTAADTPRKNRRNLYEALHIAEMATMPNPPGNRRNLSEALRIAEMATGEAVSRFQQFVTRHHKLRRINRSKPPSSSPLPIRREIPSGDFRRRHHKLRPITPMRLSSSSPLPIRGEIPSGDSRRSPHESCPVNRSEPPSDAPPFILHAAAPAFGSVLLKILPRI